MSDVHVSLDVAPVAVTVNLDAVPFTVTVVLSGTIGVPPGGNPGEVLTKTGTGPSDQAWQPVAAQGVVDAAITAHVNALDPHPAYTTAAEAAAAAPVQSVNGQTGNVIILAGDHTHANATPSVAGFLSAADKTKLDGVAAGATANATDAQLRDRATHTGTQAIATVTGLQGALDAKSETGHTHANATTLAAGFLSAADKTKLDGVAAGATANATDAQLRDRATHTGTQAISTVNGLQAALDGKSATSHTHTLSQVTDAGNAASRNVGSSAGTVCAGDDARLSDARTPTSHTHAATAISDSTPAGRTLLTAADAAAQRSALGLGSAATTAASAYVPRGRVHHLFVPAGAWIPATTAGAAPATAETTTHRVNTDRLAFDGASAEDAWFVFGLPPVWNKGTLKVRLSVDCATGASGTFTFDVAGRAYNDGDPLDAAPGTAVSVTDTALGAGTAHLGPASGDLTLAGTVQDFSLLVIRARRRPDTDTMTQDAQPLAIWVQWTEGTTEPTPW